VRYLTEGEAVTLLKAHLALSRSRSCGRGNRGFEQWGEILGDVMVAAALIDRLVHQATMITLKGKSYRLRERASTSRPPLTLRRSANPPERRPSFKPIRRQIRRQRRTPPKSKPQEPRSRPPSTRPDHQHRLCGALFSCANCCTFRLRLTA
jgi:IstB-like ATP binding protein